MDQSLEDLHRPWKFYKVGLFVLAAAAALLGLYLLIFILNPLVYGLMGDKGPEILHNAQMFSLISSVLVFGVGVGLLITGLIREENIGRNWLVVLFAAPTFFVMSAIVFIPLVQGITFAFTNANQQNISRMRPVTVIKNGRRVREKEVVPPTFEYIGLENFIEVFTGSNKRSRERRKALETEISTFVQTLNIETEAGKPLLILQNMPSHSPSTMLEEIYSRYAYKDSRSLDPKHGVISAELLADASQKEYLRVLLARQTNPKTWLKKTLLPAFKWPVFYEVLYRSMVWTFSNVFFHFVIGLALALILNKNIAFRSGYRMLLLLPWGVPQVVTAFSWRWLFNGEFGLINSVLQMLGQQSINWLSDPKLMLFAAILTNIWLGFPFMIVTLLGGLQTIPSELYESAKVDGANVLQQFWNITMPMLKTVAFTATLLGTIWTFNMFNIIFIVTGGDTKADILVTYAYKAAFQEWRIGTSTAYSVVILILLLIFSLNYMKILQRQKEF